MQEVILQITTSEIAKFVAQQIHSNHSKENKYDLIKFSYTNSK